MCVCVCANSALTLLQNARPPRRVPTIFTPPEKTKHDKVLYVKNQFEICFPQAFLISCYGGWLRFLMKNRCILQTEYDVKEIQEKLCIYYQFVAKVLFTSIGVCKLDLCLY